jgi:hypothetical protein
MDGAPINDPVQAVGWEEIWQGEIFKVTDKKQLSLNCLTKFKNFDHDLVNAC